MRWDILIYEEGTRRFYFSSVFLNPESRVSRRLHSHSSIIAAASAAADVFLFFTFAARMYDTSLASLPSEPGVQLLFC